MSGPKGWEFVGGAEEMSGAGFDSGLEYYEFLSRPTRAIREVCGAYAWEVWYEELKAWVKMSGPDAPKRETKAESNVRITEESRSWFI